MPFTLDEHNAAGYLAARGLLTPDAARRATAVALGGGVSNTVVRVDIPDASPGAGALVVKQSLPRLRVAEEWFADRERIYREAAAIKYLASALPPAAIPQALYEDRDNFLFVMTAAPPGGINWKDALLAGQIDANIAAQVGSMLGAMHRHSTIADDIADDAAIPPELRPFADQSGFVQLRIDPYHRAAAARHPDLAGVIETEAQRMLNHRRALAHGDYSPKNIIVVPGQSGQPGQRADASLPAAAPFLLDFEVAHLGNPVFDLAFMLNHLALKAIHRPELAPQYNAAAGAFWTAYRSAAGDVVAPDSDAEALERDTARQVGVLLLARVDGKSPVEYITDDERKDFIRRLARAILLDGLASLDAVHSRLADAPASV